MNKIKNLCIVLILAVVLGVLIAQMPIAHSAELSASEKALSFITDVAKIDVAKYNVTASKTTVSYPSDLGGLPKEDGGYTLECNGSKIDVMYVLVNNTFSYFHLDVSEGSPIFAEHPSTNLIERTDAFLENYQSYLGNSEFQQYRDMLSTVSEVKDTAITVGNVRFEIKQFSLGTRFRWVNTFNGADYTSFGISYRANSTDFAFGDDRYRRIGSTALNISKEQAISIAKERAQNISWTVNDVEVGNVTILDDHMGVALLTAPKEPLLLYPYWQVSLTFDKIYPGSVYGVTYSIWADTGEVFYGYMRMLGGYVPDETEPTTPPTETPTEPQIVIPTEPSTEEKPTETPTEPPPEDSTLPPTEPLTVPPPEDSTDQTGLNPIPLLIAVPIVAAIILGARFYRRRKINSH
jgi:hypothetical protein